MQIGFVVIMFIVGAVFGSFLCCQARRMRRREEKKPSLGKRSVCPHCKYKLKWYDNLPIISWLALRGKCRKCHRHIGYAEIVSELLCAAALALLATTIDIQTASTLEWVAFLTNLALVLSLCFLGIYDGLYGELPCYALVVSAVLALATIVLKQWHQVSVYGFSTDIVLNPLFAAALLGGLYLILYLMSKGKWVGDGDWLLAGIVGLALGSPWYALIALFIANLSACLIMFPVVLKSKNHKLYFGPFLVFAYIVTTVLASYGIISI